MTSYSAVQTWAPTHLRLPSALGNITRRGRLVRAILALVAVAALALLALGHLGAEQVRPTESGHALVVPSHTVTVSEGDSLWAIARAVAPEQDPREVVLEIREINGLTSSTIQPGQVLLVPTGG